MVVPQVIPLDVTTGHITGYGRTTGHTTGRYHRPYHRLWSYHRSYHWTLPPVISPVMVVGLPPVIPLDVTTGHITGYGRTTGHTTGRYHRSYHRLWSYHRSYHWTLPPAISPVITTDRTIGRMPTAGHRPCHWPYTSRRPTGRTTAVTSEQRGIAPPTHTHTFDMGAYIV